MLWSGSAGAAKPEKVTICHRAASTSNPYTSIEVAVASVDGSGANEPGGHPDHYLEHRGPVDPLADGEWGDIIPPIEGVHDGYNWDVAAQAIYDNGCKLVTTPSSTSTTNTSSITTTTLG